MWGLFILEVCLTVIKESKASYTGVAYVAVRAKEVCSNTRNSNTVKNEILIIKVMPLILNLATFHPALHLRNTVHVYSVFNVIIPIFLVL